MKLYNKVLIILTIYNLDNLIYFQHDVYQKLHIQSQYLLMMNRIPIQNMQTNLSK